MTPITYGFAVFPCHSIGADGQCTCGKGSACNSPGKHPRTVNGVKDATRDPEQIAKWAAQWPDAINWAVATGAVSGVFVVDDDGPKHGTDALAAWERDNGALPETFTVRSGGGGWHRYFKYPTAGTVPGRNSGKWLEHVDVKSDGGYVLLPGSRHVSGDAYEVANANDGRRAEAPDALLTAIRGASGSSISRRAQLDSASILDGVPEGERDDKLFRWACGLRRKHQGDSDGGEKVVRTLVLEAARNCTPPFPEDQALVKVDQAFKQEHAEHDDYLVTQLNDEANATFLVDRYGYLLRRCSDLGRWMTWNGQVWESGDEVALGIARRAARDLRQLADEAFDSATRVRIKKHAEKSLSAPRIEGMLRLAKSDPRVRAKSTDFDVDPYLINTRTGIVDLRTGVLSPHDPAAMMSRCTSVGYAPDGKRPLWMALVHHACDGDPERIEYLQRALGHAITGDPGQLWFLLHSKMGGTGKSTLLFIILLVLGKDYSMQASYDLMTRREGSHTTDIADLMGKRFVAVVETERGKSFNERFLKYMTGGDMMRARRMRQDNVEWAPSHTMFVATNHEPPIRDTSDAQWRRVNKVPYTETKVPEHEKIEGYPRIVFEEEGDAILGWLVEGAVKWWDNGKKSLKIPKAIADATAAYRKKEDIFLQWSEECLADDPKGFVATAALEHEMEVWAKSEGIPKDDWLTGPQIVAEILERFKDKPYVKKHRQQIVQFDDSGQTSYARGVRGIKISYSQPEGDEE